MFECLVRYLSQSSGRAMRLVFLGGNRCGKCLGDVMWLEAEQHVVKIVGFLTHLDFFMRAMDSLRRRGFEQLSVRPKVGSPRRKQGAVQRKCGV